MWRIPKDNNLKPSLGGFVPPISRAQHSRTPNTPAAVSQGIKIKGEISGNGNLSLDGEFEGKIRLVGGTFTVGPNARVSAEIEAREVVIYGEVRGALKSCERVHIWGTGKLIGDLEARDIVVENGAVLDSEVAVPKAPVHEQAGSEASISAIDQPSPTSRSEMRAKGAAGGQ